MSSDQMKSNWVKLSCLIINQGTKAVRKFFNSIHSPANLPAVLDANKTLLDELRKSGVINQQEMDLLFPPSGKRTTSSNYDISLLFVLIRHICSLRFPTSTNKSWDAKPPSQDRSRIADLIRIKYYRNVLCHMNKTEVSDFNFNLYWGEIQDALVRLGARNKDIVKLKTKLLGEDHYLRVLYEWYEKEHKAEVVRNKILKEVGTIGEDGKIEHQGNTIGTKTKTVRRIMRKIARNISWIIMRAALWILLLMFVFYLVANSHSGKDL